MENFIVSARKYRPQEFDTVVGQSHITDTLEHAIEESQLAQALLFADLVVWVKLLVPEFWQEKSMRKMVLFQKMALL
jgi:adenosyl cobinamide kinase/adenosyl cobinamide phosphate guanylyltransferase